MIYDLGIDTRMLRHTGIGTYLKGLLSHLETSGLAGNRQICLFGDPATNGRLRDSNFQPFRSSIYSLTEQLEYPFRLAACRLWHAPHYNVPLRKGKTKLVVTIHDIIHWKFRGRFFSPFQAAYARLMLGKAVQSADHILTVSESTRQDLITDFKASPEKISVTYEGVAESFKPSRDEKKSPPVISGHKIRSPYFLYVGMLKEHKNVHWLIRLFRRLKKAGKVQSALVLVGPLDPTYQKKFPDDLQIRAREDIVHFPSVSPSDLLSLYQGAVALIHPSLYEGFGLTLLEAMACATPVVAFRTSSIPEVAGDAAWLITPDDEEALEQALHRLEDDSTFRNKLAEKGIEQAGKFRWADMTQKTVEIYDRLLKS